MLFITIVIHDISDLWYYLCLYEDRISYTNRDLVSFVQGPAALRTALC